MASVFLCAVFIAPAIMAQTMAGLIGGAVIAAIVCAIMAGAMKTAHKKTDANGYIPGSGVTLMHRSDHFTHRTVTRQPINRDNSGSKKT